MASKFHPIYSGVWKDPRLEGLPFECKAFFAWLFSNDFVRPSGIYRVTDAQAAAETELPVARVRRYFTALASCGRIVRDGAWVFIRGYLKRQPNHDNLRKSARLDVESCTSVGILKAFGERYPLYNQWSADRLATIRQPMNETRSSEQCSCIAEQSSTENKSREQIRGAVGSADPSASPSKPLFALWPKIDNTLTRCRILGAARHVRDPAWWLAELEANQTVDLVEEILKAEAWLAANPTRRKSDHRRFLHNWLARADREE